MKSAKLVLIAFATCGLAACGGGADQAAEGAPEEAPEPTAEQVALDREPAFASTYTEFDLEACKVLQEEREEGSSADYSCPGFGKTPLLIQEGDGRFDLDAGADDDSFQTVGAFNDIADTVEWRLKDGTPFAVIFRYRDVSMESKGRTVLAVETIGTDKIPGCRVAQIAGDTPDANVKARELADAASDVSFVCPERPALIGNAQ